MSSIADPQSELPDGDALVAYLDGELPPDECRRVESRLATDADYRRQLRGLDQAWEALNALPATRADDDFARTTMQLVTVAAEGELTQDLSRAATARRRRAWRWVGAGLAACIAGFFAAWMLFARSERTMLDDLPIIRHVNALTQLEDVEFLRQLSREVPAEELVSDEATIKDELGNLMADGPDAHSSRRAWLESLPTDQTALLAAQANRFHDLPRDERERLRRRYREISEAADEETLRTQLIAYGQWLAKLRPAQEEELRELTTTDERIAFIADEVRRDREQSLRRLSPADATKLREAVLAIADERRAKFEEELRRRDDGRLRRLDGSRSGFALAVLFRELRNDEIRGRLEAALSDDARARLDEMSPIQRGFQLWRWTRDSLRPEWGPGELERFFTEELPVAQRERLLQLPPGEMQPQLERLYVAQFGDGTEWWIEDRDGGDGRRRGGQGRPNFPPDGRDTNRRDGPPEMVPPDQPDRARRRPPRPQGPDGRPIRPAPRPNGPPPPNATSPEAI